MSDAIYFATRNFSTTFESATKLPYNPTRALRKATEAMACSVRRDDPRKSLYRNSIPVHLTKMVLVGPRLGTRLGASAVHKLHKAARSFKSPMLQASPKSEYAPIRKQGLAGSLAGLAGTVMGGLLGLTLKSSEHLGVAGLYLGGMLLGATIGTCVGLPVAGAYALHVAASSNKRKALRATRQELNASAMKAFGGGSDAGSPRTDESRVL